MIFYEVIKIYLFIYNYYICTFNYLFNNIDEKNNYTLRFRRSY